MLGANRSPSLAGTAPEPSLLRLPLIDWLGALRGVRARTHLLWLGGILLVALALRLAWVAAVQPDPRDGRFDDSVWYYGTGKHLADGDGYVFPTDAFCARNGGADCDQLPPTALWAPGYPLVLAGLFLLPGDDVAAGRALNVAAGLALVAGVYFLGSRLWDRRAGLIAAAIMAFFPSQIFFSSLLLTETLFTAAALGLLCLAVAWTLRDGVAWWRVFLLGVAAAVVGMVRPEGAFIVLAIIASWVAVHRSWRRVGAYVGLLVLGMAVLYVPWTVRNMVQLDAPVVGTTGMGQVLIQGHNPDAGGRPDLYAVTQLWNRFDHVPFPEREVRINNAGVSDSIDYAVHHIPRELSLVPHRLAWFFRNDDSVLFWLQNSAAGEPKEMSAAWQDRWGDVANVYYYTVLGAMVLGLPFWLRRMDRRHVLLWGPFAVYTAMWAFIFVGEARYHFPLLPVFALLAAVGLTSFLQRILPAKEAPATAALDP